MPLVVTVYLRNNMIYVAPKDGFVTIEPVLVVNKDNSELSSALTTAFAAAPSVPTTRYDFRNYKSPVRMAAGMMSARAFERGLRMCTVSLIGAEYQLRRWLPDFEEKVGFSLDPAWEVDISSASPMKQIATCLLEAFEDPDWPTRK